MTTMMKKVVSLSVVALLAFASCNKDKGPDITYEQSALLGTWKQVKPVVSEDNCSSPEALVEINNTQFIERILCDGSIRSSQTVLT